MMGCKTRQLLVYVLYQTGLGLRLVWLRITKMGFCKKKIKEIKGVLPWQEFREFDFFFDDSFNFFSTFT